MIPIPWALTHLLTEWSESRTHTKESSLAITRDSSVRSFTDDGCFLLPSFFIAPLYPRLPARASQGCPFRPHPRDDTLGRAAICTCLSPYVPLHIQQSLLTTHGKRKTPKHTHTHTHTHKKLCMRCDLLEQNSML